MDNCEVQQLQPMKSQEGRPCFQNNYNGNLYLQSIFNQQSQKSMNMESQKDNVNHLNFFIKANDSSDIDSSRNTKKQATQQNIYTEQNTQSQNCTDSTGNNTLNTVRIQIKSNQESSSLDNSELNSSRKHLDNIQQQSIYDIQDNSTEEGTKRQKYSLKIYQPCKQVKAQHKINQFIGVQQLPDSKSGQQIIILRCQNSKDTSKKQISLPDGKQKGQQGKQTGHQGQNIEHSVGKTVAMQQSRAQGNNCNNRVVAQALLNANLQSKNEIQFPQNDRTQDMKDQQCQSEAAQLNKQHAMAKILGKRGRPPRATALQKPTNSLQSNDEGSIKMDIQPHVKQSNSHTKIKSQDSSRQITSQSQNEYQLEIGDEYQATISDFVMSRPKTIDNRHEYYLGEQAYVGQPESIIIGGDKTYPYNTQNPSSKNQTLQQQKQFQNQIDMQNQRMVGQLKQHVFSKNQTYKNAYEALGVSKMGKNLLKKSQWNPEQEDQFAYGFYYYRRDFERIQQVFLRNLKLKDIILYYYNVWKVKASIRARHWQEKWKNIL